MDDLKYLKFVPDIIDDYNISPNLYIDYKKEVLAAKKFTMLKGDNPHYLAKVDPDTKMYGLIKGTINLINKKSIIIKHIEDIIFGMVQSQAIIPLSIMAAFFKEEKRKRTVYVIQKTFFDKFKNLDFKMLQYKHLSSNMRGYIHLPEGIEDSWTKRKYTGFFFFIGDATQIQNDFFKLRQENTYDIDTTKILGIAYIDDKLELSFDWRYFPLDLNITVASTFQNVTRTVMSDKGIVTQNVDNAYEKNLAMMVNLLVYLSSGQPDIREFTNPITYQSTTSQTPIKKDKNLSLSKIIQVGFNYKKESLKHADEWSVMPHLRWQKCGEGLQEIKLVYVKGHTKSWKEK